MHEEPMLCLFPIPLSTLENLFNLGRAAAWPHPCPEWTQVSHVMHAAVRSWRNSHPAYSLDFNYSASPSVGLFTASKFPHPIWLMPCICIPSIPPGRWGAPHPTHADPPDNDQVWSPQKSLPGCCLVIGIGAYLRARCQQRTSKSQGIITGT